MKFCFLCNDVTASVQGRTIGGGELQTFLLAKALAHKGHETVIIDPISPCSFITEEGIQVLHVPGWYKGLPGLRLFSHRLPGLYKLLVKQKADFYYVRMRSFLHMLSFIAARKVCGKFITAIAHDLDVMKFSQKFKYEYWPKFNALHFFLHQVPNDLVFNFILKRSDYITIQHTGQGAGLYNVKGKVALFPNIFEFNSLPSIKNPSRDYFIHVGSLTMLKGAGNLIDLVQILDRKKRVIVVGKPRGAKLERMYKDITLFRNIVLKGRLSQKETLQLIGNAKALISTSNFEGFPNIFLEAWAQGVPVISLNVDPGSVISKFDLGVCCNGNLHKMKECMESDMIENFSGEKLITYVKQNHDFNNAAEGFLDILNDAVTVPTKDYYESSLLYRFLSRRRKRAQTAGAYEGTERKIGY